MFSDRDQVLRELRPLNQAEGSFQARRRPDRQITTS